MNGNVVYKYSISNNEPMISEMGIGEICLNIFAGNEYLYVKARENAIVKLRVDGTSNMLKNDTEGHITNKENPHRVTKENIGLSFVENHSDKLRLQSNAEASVLERKLNKDDIAAVFKSDNSGKDYAQLPMSASVGVIFSDTVIILNNMTDGLEALSNRITQLENWN